MQPIHNTAPFSKRSSHRWYRHLGGWMAVCITGVGLLSFLFTHDVMLREMFPSHREIDVTRVAVPSRPTPLPHVYPNHLYQPVQQPAKSVLRLYRKTDDAPQLLHSGSVVLEGDEVQIQYVAQQRYGIILSVDGRGRISLHHPDTGTVSQKMNLGTHLLPFAFALDDAPGFEIFIIVSSEVPISLKDVEKTAARIKTAADPLPSFGEHVQASMVVLHKLQRE